MNAASRRRRARSRRRKAKVQRARDHEAMLERAVRKIGRVQIVEEFEKEMASMLETINGM